MKLEEVSKLIDQTKNKVVKTIKENQKLFDEGCSDIEKYDKKYMVTRDERTSGFEDMVGIDVIIHELSEFKEKFEDGCYPGLNIFVSTKTSSDCDDYSYVEENCVVASWCVPGVWTDNEIESRVRQIIRDAVSKKLKPEGAYLRTVDCKMMELFMSGTIDWEALQKITYSDCKI